MSAAVHRSGVAKRSEICAAVVHSAALAIACVISYELITHVLAPLHSVSQADDYLGGMWAVIATVFVYRIGHRESVAAASSRTVATLFSFAICLVYLLLFPFSPVGLAVVIGFGSLVVMLIGRPEEIVTTAITTAV